MKADNSRIACVFLGLFLVIMAAINICSINTAYAGDDCADKTNAINVDPSFNNYAIRAYCYQSADNYDMAIYDYGKAIQLNDSGYVSNAFYYIGRGVAYHYKGEYDKAIADFNISIPLSSESSITSHTYERRAAAYYSKGDFETALDDLNKSIELDRKHEVSYLIHLVVSSKISRDAYVLSQNKLRQIVAEKPSPNYETLRMISKYYLAMDNVTETAILAESRKGKRDTEIKTNLARAYYFLGEKRLRDGNKLGAEEFFNKCLEVSHGYPLAVASKRLLTQDSVPLSDPLYDLAMKQNSIVSLTEYLDSKEITSEYRKKTIQALAIKIKGQANPVELLDKYSEKYPELLESVSQEDALKLIGPQGMKVYQIAALQKKKKFSSETIASKILASGAQYKDFSFQEMEKLTDMGITENVINAMLKSSSSPQNTEDRNIKQKPAKAMRADEDYSRQTQEPPREQRSGSSAEACRANCSQMQSACYSRCDNVGKASVGRNLFGAILSGGQPNLSQYGQDIAGVTICQNECQASRRSCDIGCGQ